MKFDSRTFILFLTVFSISIACSKSQEEDPDQPVNNNSNNNNNGIRNGPIQNNHIQQNGHNGHNRHNGHNGHNGHNRHNGHNGHNGPGQVQNGEGRNPHHPNRQLPNRHTYFLNLDQYVANELDEMNREYRNRLRNDPRHIQNNQRM